MSKLPIIIYNFFHDFSIGRVFNDSSKHRNLAKTSILEKQEFVLEKQKFVHDSRSSYYSDSRTRTEVWKNDRIGSVTKNSPPQFPVGIRSISEMRLAEQHIITRYLVSTQETAQVIIFHCYIITEINIVTKLMYRV